MWVTIEGDRWLNSEMGGEEERWAAKKRDGRLRKKMFSLVGR
jgi:hypothetical protein